MKYVVALWCCLLSVSAFAEFPKNFAHAKRLAWALYAERPETFYCGCRFEKNRTDSQSCGYRPRKNAQRGARVEWEHIVSAWEFGHQRQCWQNGGRKNCEKNDQQFQRMEADLHNLVPAVGELNGDRSNFRFGMLEGEARAYGKCDFEVDFKLRRAEPAEHRRGDIARIYFYMRDQYGLNIGRQQLQLLQAWHRQDPVDEYEIWRDEQIERIQGNRNCYVRRCSQLAAE